MSTTINWQTLDDKEQTRLILEHVMRCTFADSIYVYRGSVVSYPICAYYEDYEDDEAWYIRYEENTNKFDPLHDLNAAWLIIEKLGIPTTLNYTPGFEPQEPGGQSAHHECKIIQLDFISGNDKIARAIANTPAEAICVAALRWIGIQVTHTIEAMPCWEVTFENGETLICKNKYDAEQIIVQREQYLKDNLQWAVNVRKLKIAEVMVPEDYFNGPVIG